jgi:hypothetical protein
MGNLFDELRKIPDFTKRYEALTRRYDRASRLTNWMTKIPVVGHLACVFWFCIFSEGIRDTLTPRWGALTFSFLNDGIKPTWYHTWHEVTHNNYNPLTEDCDVCGIWPQGAPKRPR